MVVSMVMEIGEVDLAKVLHQHQKSSEQPKQHGAELSLNFIRLTWQQMLEAVQCIHDNRIVHGDLKPANFVFVKGQLKLIDFGIAKAISNDTTNIVRESQIGTVNYMAPEAIAPIMVEDADSDAPRMKVTSKAIMPLNPKYHACASRPCAVDGDSISSVGRATSGAWGASCIRWSMADRPSPISTPSRSCTRSRTRSTRSVTQTSQTAALSRA
jgi:serine/threonine protein kinase